MIRTLSLLLVVAAAVSASADENAKILPVEANRERAVEIRSWNPASPQKLVRIDDRLYQEDAGRYFGVIPGRITVRLADGVESWDGGQSNGRSPTSPAEFEILARLRPARANRLGVLRSEGPRRGRSACVVRTRRTNRAGPLRRDRDLRDVPRRSERSAVHRPVVNEQHRAEQWDSRGGRRRRTCLGRHRGGSLDHRRGARFRDRHRSRGPRRQRLAQRRRDPRQRRSTTTSTATSTTGKAGTSTT